jgi:DNA-binding response OmpR family regulator
VHILLVEDEVRLGRAVRRLLLEEGHAVDYVQTGEDALSQAQAEDYDLVLLDVMLPGIDGFAVARRLRAAGSTAPLLMLTARDSVPDRVEGLDSGADDYLVKPFALEELLARVRAMGRRTEMNRLVEGVLRYEDLELDLRSRQARRGGRCLDLTTREFTLLETLMRNPGQVLTRSQLLDRVWDMSAEVESNIVDTYIYYLRNKIDRGFERKLIKTVRGAGYALRVH